MRRPALVVAALLVIGTATAVVVVARGGSGDDGAAPSTVLTSTTTTTTTAPAPDGPDFDAATATATEPADPAALAQVIEEAETAVRSPATPEDELEQWARIQQAAYRTLARLAEWEEAVTAALDPAPAEIARVNAQANRELWALTDPRPQLPDWTIVAPPPAEELLGHYRAAEAEFGVPWTYLAAIHLVESRMGRIRGDSVAGAKGPMQFLPSTWEAYGEGDIEDYGDAIRAAARYLRAHGAPGDMGRALFAYNHSDHYVRAIETYAALMAEDERAYLGYYHWQVYYRLVTGDVVLPVGWGKESP